MNYSKLLFTVVFGLTNLTAAAADTFDPSAYLRAKAASAEALNQVKQAEVMLGGKPYLRFSSNAGSIVVPKVTGLSPQDLEASLCSNKVIPAGCDRNHPEHCRPEQRGLAQTPSVRVETPVVHTETSLAQNYIGYAELIQVTIEQKCNGDAGPPPFGMMPQTLEAGVATRKSGREAGEEKAFLRTNDPLDPSPKLKPQAGVGLSF